MKLKLNRGISLVALGVIASLSQVQAAPVYEILNIEETVNPDTGLVEIDLSGTIEGTRNGYAMGVNANDELIGVSKGKRKLSDDDFDDDLIDVEDGLLPQERITYSVYLPIQANNFTFTAEENHLETPWNPEFFSIAGTTPPTERDDEGELIVNSIDTYFYGLNDAGVKVGARTGEERTLPYEGEIEDQEFWYYRDFENRGVAIVNDSELTLPPPYTTYLYEATEDFDEQEVNVGGASVIASVNNDNIAVGYATTDIAEQSKSYINTCVEQSLEPSDEDNPVPLEACIQNLQYPDTNSSFVAIQYQMRAGVWDLDVLDEDGVPEFTELELGLTPDDDSTSTFVAQGLGINPQGDIVVGRSHVYRNDNRDKLRQDAAFWSKNSAGEYEYNWVPMIDDIFRSIAYDVNDSGLLVGSYERYINGYQREKFFIYDTTNPDAEVITPDDFLAGLSDLSSRPKDINSLGQVVGNIEVTFDKEKPRPKAGFLYNHNDESFSNINALLTCESRGYMLNDGQDWERRQVTVIDGTGERLTYDSEIYVVEANGINEDGTIVGTAFIRKPTFQYDEDGNLILGENNKPFFELNANGEPLTSTIPRMVVMKPVNGEACTVSDREEETPYERKGAASLAWLLALPLLWMRRRFTWAK
ncbi:DUF3466 family protein [Shewanella maritima]|uniref:DUF3466 family protein n=1 Tax=Shewanella maritima TaxID=2520507 RepID=UPI00373536BC